MVSQEVVERARRNQKIDGRYENIRKDWTPRQIRRMRKKHNKDKGLK